MSFEEDEKALGNHEERMRQTYEEDGAECLLAQKTPRSIEEIGNFIRCMAQVRDFEGYYPRTDFSAPTWHRRRARKACKRLALSGNYRLVKDTKIEQISVV